MTLTTFLRAVEVITYIASTTAVLVFSFAAYRRTKLRAFAFWIWSCTIGIIMMSAWYIRYYSPPSSHADYMTFTVIYRISFIVVNILGAIGSVMLIQHFLAMLDSESPPDKSLQPTAITPSVSDER